MLTADITDWKNYIYCTSVTRLSRENHSCVSILTLSPFLFHIDNNITLQIHVFFSDNWWKIALHLATHNKQQTLCFSCNLSTYGLMFNGGHSIGNKTPSLWLGQNNYILCPVCVSSTPEFCQPCQSHNVTILYNASWRKEAACSSYLPRGPWYQWYDIGVEAQWTNTLLRENNYSDLGSKCQGYSPALCHK